MQIKDAERRTGLTAKAIRLYEKKGLVSVERCSNAYRTYTEEQIERLCEIRRFRTVGVPLADIRLWADGILSEKELLQKRLDELLEGNGLNKDRERLCRAYLNRDSVATEKELFDDPALFIPPESDAHRLTLGLDIGTTTVSAAVVDMSDGRQIACYTLANASGIDTPEPYRHEQNAARIAETLLSFLDSVLGAFPGLSAIGVTGQMHGIVYTDTDGNAVSPLYTWQDERAAQPSEKDGKSICDRIADKTGYTINPGYGWATHVYNECHGLCPASAVTLCTVGDYAVMRITDRKRPLLHTSNAASLGLFDRTKNAFDSTALQALGIPLSFLPEVTAELAVVGYYREIPVTVAVGDNQASFFGAVRDEAHDLSVNCGTGSQITLRVPASAQDPALPLERRPYFDGYELLCGSALCGGRAYALLERFFRTFVGSNEPQYDRLNEFAAQAFEKRNETAPLQVSTRFCGSRADLTARGSVHNLGEDNFTPQALALGVLRGIAEELGEMYRAGGALCEGRLVASGNALRKNEVLRKVFSEVFGKPIYLPSLHEEAAFGAALLAARGGLGLSVDEVKRCIPECGGESPK